MNDPTDAASSPDRSTPGVWQARLLHIFISHGHDYWTRGGEGRLQHGSVDLDQVECVAGMGLRGDRYFNKRPDAKGQVTFMAAQAVADIRREFKLPKLPAAVFRRNLVVDGVDLKDWLGRTFVFQDLTFEGTQECCPCDWMDRVVAPGCQDFMKIAFRGGLRAKVLSSGTIHRG
jgi:MOSC domain-containing protein YiiM